MTIMQTQFDALAARCGSDCWNPGHIVRRVLATYPDAKRIETYVTTGLWCECDVTRQDGIRSTMRVLG